MDRMRTLLAFLLGLVVVAACATTSQSDPADGVRVATVEELNALEQRVTALEEKAAAPAPSPTPTPSEMPKPSESPSPTQTPTPTPTPTSSPSPAAWPGADNTGPTGTLTAISRNMWVDEPGTVIENKVITGAVEIVAPNVTIRNSRINGYVMLYDGASLTIVDSLVDNGTNVNLPGVGPHSITMKRTEVRGGAQSVACKWDCDIRDSWLHGQYMHPTQPVHGDGFLANEANNVTLIHNTLACDSEPNGSGGACSAGLAMYGDWGPVQNVLVQGNLFKASPAGYCMYGGELRKQGKEYGAQNVDVIGNVFELGGNGKCGLYGAATGKATDAESTWSNNRFVDGTAVN